MVLQRIGIFPGTFNPVHSGHIMAAMQAVDAASLNNLYFLLERNPRRKNDVEHFGHRYGMLTRAVRPHQKLKVLDLPDRQFSVLRTLPRLRVLFPESPLVFVIGSDVAMHIAAWEDIAALRSVEFCVVMRRGHNQKAITSLFRSLKIDPKNITFVQSLAPSVSSSKLRMALQQKRSVQGLLASVRVYASREWLYL